ncbi:hypothetical protein H257_14544, partial [Aphanomyces astaci]
MGVVEKEVKWMGDTVEPAHRPCELATHQRFPWEGFRFRVLHEALQVKESLASELGCDMRDAEAHTGIILPCLAQEGS